MSLVTRTSQKTPSRRPVRSLRGASAKLPIALLAALSAACSASSGKHQAVAGSGAAGAHCSLPDCAGATSSGSTGSSATAGSSAAAGRNDTGSGGRPDSAGHSAAGGGSGSGNAGSTAAGSGSISNGSCDQGSTTTTWASDCPTTTPACSAGTWTPWGSSSPENYPLHYETAHFAFYWPDTRNVAMADAQAAGDFLENVVWHTYMGSPIFFPEPYCNATDKKKTSIHIVDSGLSGGCNAGRPGMWIGPGALKDHWGIGHEFTHALQCMTAGVADCNPCWFHESHANFMPHQLPEYRSDVHCSEMLVNAPHLYYGSTRDRYCNWQFWEFVKDKYCYKAVNDVWAGSAPAGQREPLSKLAATQGWDVEKLNDVFGEWAMHNISWDYRNPPPTTGTDQGSVYRSNYGVLTDKSRPERNLRLTALEPLDTSYAANRRFVSPYFWAPQRGGYNVVRLYPEAGAAAVSVRFRGVTQAGANSGWRWGLVATDAKLTTSRYSAMQRGADAELSFCVGAGESVWLVVVGAPTVMQKIMWDQPYPSIYRYPYMIELQGAWPAGFRNGAPEACASGERHVNGGGCAPSNLAASVYVGPYAQVLGGNVSGNARIDDHAVVLNGATVSGGSVGALSVLMSGFSVSDTARLETTFYPLGFFEGKSASGSARIYGDVEYRAAKASGSYYGMVEATTASETITEITSAPPYVWRP